MLDDIIPVWFFDESGFWGGCKPRKVLAFKGSKPVYHYNGEHIRETIMGAVNIKTGQLETLLMPTSDTNTFQQFLDHFNNILQGEIIILILDNASWHKPAKLKWNNIVPLYLPPYSPNLNPIERIWKVLKDMMPVFTEISSHTQLQDMIINNLKHFFDNPQEVISICKFSDIIK